MRYRSNDERDEIERHLARRAEPVSARTIAAELPSRPPLRTVQYRLARLVESGRVVREGRSKAVRYRAAVGARAGFLRVAESPPFPAEIPLSPGAMEIRAYVRQPLLARKPTGYDRRLLVSYRPNVSAYLSRKERAHLASVGRTPLGPQPAGTYARQILGRLLIDLSWNSSRLEGNTYSLLDTKRLIEFGRAAKGRARVETQMVLNHKEAIEFLVGAAGEIGFNRFTLLNIHALLANNLLADRSAEGRLRFIEVGIEGSVYLPLAIPQAIDECFDRLLATAAAIRDPFEQALFAMVHLPYLQPFDDGNKRVSRLAANIPLIRGNLVPLAFTEVPREVYAESILGVYECGKIQLLKDVFIWAYERSAARYAAVRQSLGEPDPFRLRYHTELRTVVAEAVRARLGRLDASRHVERQAKKLLPHRDRSAFIAAAEDDLAGLHDGNFARYRVTPSEYAAWKENWSAG